MAERGRGGGRADNTASAATGDGECDAWHTVVEAAVHNACRDGHTHTHTHARLLPVCKSWPPGGSICSNISGSSFFGEIERGMIKNICLEAFFNCVQISIAVTPGHPRYANGSMKLNGRVKWSYSYLEAPRYDANATFQIFVNEPGQSRWNFDASLD